MIASPIFVRVVAADKNRGFVMLVGYDAKVVQRTAIQQISLTGVRRTELQAALDRVKTSYNASVVNDVTGDGIKKRLEKNFQSTDPKVAE